MTTEIMKMDADTKSIHTAVELDGLPCHSVAISAERLVVAQRCTDDLWRMPGHSVELTSQQLIELGLAPFDVLFRPGTPRSTVSHPGLVVSADGQLLNWLGQNYVPQT